VYIVGAAKNVLRRQLEAVLALPGVNPKVVKVYYVFFYFNSTPHSNPELAK